jgi:hypothetical protein
MPRDARQAYNRALFRAVNEQIADLTSGAVDGEPQAFICECSRVGCTEQINEPLPIYMQVADTPAAYLVVSGHEDPTAEKTIFGHGGYVIVVPRTDD